MHTYITYIYNIYIYDIIIYACLYVRVYFCVYIHISFIEGVGGGGGGAGRRLFVTEKITSRKYLKNGGLIISGKVDSNI